jgi:hypothetical protein
MIDGTNLAIVNCDGVYPFANKFVIVVLFIEVVVPRNEFEPKTVVVPTQFKVTEVNTVHMLKAFEVINVTALGIVTLSNELQFSKHPSDIDVREFESIILDSDVQL